MSLSRYATHRVRAHYLRALRALPIPAPPPDRIDPKDLTVLGQDRIADRPVLFGTLTDAPRLWAAFDSPRDALIGYCTGLVGGEPDLWVCNETHRAWTLEGGNAAALKRAALRVWTDCRRECEG